jgi:hypothetical protein
MTWAQWGVLAVAGGIAACRLPTNCGAAPVLLSGKWDYAAAQTTPAKATLTGVLTVSPQSCADFQGSLDLTQRDDLGNLTPLHGVVSGQMLDIAGVQLDAFLAAGGRHHVGTLAHDSIKGIWVEQTSAEIASSGSFVAVLKAVP